MAKHESAKTRAEKITKQSNAAAEGSDSLFESLDTTTMHSVQHTDPTIVKTDVDKPLTAAQRKIVDDLQLPKKK